MARVPHVLYDTAPIGTTANAVHTLYQTSQGGDATHDKQFTNMRGAGALPTSEMMTVFNVGITLDEDTIQADLELLFYSSRLELFIKDRSIFRLPLAWCARGMAWSGAYTLAVAADDAHLGIVGDGYELREPVTIDGGDVFRVEIIQGGALSAAMSVIVGLEGMLER